jgi:succinyl-CoA synthetase beta subunit
VPEIAEAEINPLIPTAAGLVAVDVRVRLAPVALEDPWLRTLPA